MLHKLRLAHRLLLIYLLSFVAVVVLAYSLVVEKNIAIRFAQKEQRGAAYIAVVRDALLAIVEDHLAEGVPAKASGRRVPPNDYASRILAAEAQYGREMRTQTRADELSALLLRFGERSASGASHNP